MPEIKVHHNRISTGNLINFENYSNANKLIRIVAYILRFINNCKTKSKNKCSLEPNELKQSLEYLLKTSQRESFMAEIETLARGKPLKSKSSILQLTPFLDEHNVLRVGGRLTNSDLDFDRKHPALLSGKHHFTKILMEAEHIRLFHAGPQLLLCTFREKYWPIGGRALARNVVRKCIICTRLKAKPMEPLLGNLPLNRITQFYPFQICGTDFAGPFMISSKKGRGNRISKAYLCLFICFATKALHLETVSDLSAQAFISCLKRFIARRGKPHRIYCDNGKNFVGANNELGKVLRASLRFVKDFSANEGIQFCFTPPYSPTFGGLWEAGVKSAKYHIKRVVGNASLTFEELSTLFAQIEAILNSRPLTPLSSDPKDLSPLSPGHFLVGRQLTSLPTPPGDVSGNIRTRYQLIDQIRRHFWNRWSHEYLSELQERKKCRLKKEELKPGDMVVFKEENLPPLKWRLARVHQLYPGSDGVCRVADFITYRGIERRGLNRVCPLPVNDDLESLERATFQGGADC